jgi:hypothetical protein
MLSKPRVANPLTQTLQRLRPARLWTRTAPLQQSETDSLATAIDSICVNNIRLALKPNVATHESSTAALAHRRSDASSEEHAAGSADSSPSLFAKIPGELRNRIYRAYFEDFREQKKKTLNIKKTAPAYLNLLHTDRMIRSESSSIFFKERFCIDSFFALKEDLEHAMESRIKAICTLVAVHDIHLPISITVQEMISVHAWMFRQLPWAWDDFVRRSFVDELARFIANRTREVFVCRTGSQQQPQDPGNFPNGHMVYVGRKVHVSPRYRIERVDPDAAITPQQKLEQEQQHNELLQVLGMIAQEQRWEVLHGRHPGDEQLHQELEELESAEFLRLEGPLAELDWNNFQWRC